jgi:hypothetical protein
VLFDASQRGKIDEILSRCGLKRFRAAPQMQYNAIEDYIGFDKETAKIWHMHLHYRLTLGEKHLKGYTVSWAKDILNNRVYDRQLRVYTSHPDNEYFLLLLRIALKLRWRDYLHSLGSNDITEIQWLKPRTERAKVIEAADKYLDSKCLKIYEKLLSRKNGARTTRCSSPCDF